MSDLVAWLREQLDEDERVANSATSGPWNNDDPMLRDAVFSPAVDDWVADCRYEQMGPFALTEIEAKRQILELHEHWFTSEGDMCSCCEESGLRPGYDEAWRP